MLVKVVSRTFQGQIRRKSFLLIFFTVSDDYQHRVATEHIPSEHIVIKRRMGQQPHGKLVMASKQMQI